MEIKCAIPGCDRKKRKKIFCQKHYRQIELGILCPDTFKQLRPLKRKRSYKNIKCAFEGCLTQARKLGYCSKHYSKKKNRTLLKAAFDKPRCRMCKRQIWKKGYCRSHYSDYINAMRKRKCHIENCEKRVATDAKNGMCTKHENWLQKGWVHLDGQLTKKYRDRFPNVGMKCKAPDCEVDAKTRGYCVKHYVRWKKGQELSDKKYVPSFYVNHGKPCKIKGCKNKPIWNQYCAKHKWRLDKGIDMEIDTYELRIKSRGIEPARGLTCKAENCDKPVRAKGYCQLHHGRFSRNVPIEDEEHAKFIKSKIKNKGKTCSRKGCDKPAKNKRLCAKHYERLIKKQPLDDEKFKIYQKEKREKRLPKCKECGRKHFAKGYCAKHYERLRSGRPINDEEHKKYLKNLKSRFKIKWTKEKCVEEAQKYKTKDEWRVSKHGSYDAARRNGWFEECTDHMIEIIKPKNYWTKERCIEETKKFKSLKEWREKGSKSYDAARRNGWADECSAHMARDKIRWTLQKCQNEAIKYKSKKEWERNSKKSYEAACRHKWIKECSEHMTILSPQSNCQSSKLPKEYFDEDRTDQNM